MTPVKIRVPETRQEWLAQRRVGLGGSDAGVVRGDNAHKTAYTLWCEKTGRVIPEDTDSEAARLGRDLEDYVAKRFTEATGKKVRKSSFSYQHPDYPWMLGNVDRLVIGERAGLECKTVGQFSRIDFDGGDIPQTYYDQCMHYLAVTGLDRWYICLLKFQEEPKIFVIERDEEEIRCLIEQERAFWECVETDTPPDPTAFGRILDNVNERYPESTPQTMQIDDEHVMRYLEYKAKEAEYKKLKEDQEALIKAEMGEAEKAVCETATISWKTSKPRSSIDTERLQKELPEIYKNYLKVGEAQRRFSVKGAK